MSASTTCHKCGQPLPDDAPQGTCPNCLLALLGDETIQAGTAGQEAQPPASIPFPGRPFGDYELLERRWAMTLLERGLARLEEEFNRAGNGAVFAVLRPFLLGEQEELTYADVAPHLGMAAAAAKMAASRMRARWRELLREDPKPGCRC